MPLDAEMLGNDLRKVLADFPQSATFIRGARRFTVACACDMVGGGASPDGSLAGMDLDDSSELFVDAYQCVFAPRPGDLFEVAGFKRRYRVSSFRFVPADAAYVVRGEVC